MRAASLLSIYHGNIISCTSRHRLKCSFSIIGKKPAHIKKAVFGSSVVLACCKKNKERFTGQKERGVEDKEHDRCTI